MKPNPKIIRELVDAAATFDRYPYELMHKDAFHAKGRTVMKYVAQALGLKKGEFKIQSCKGGIAVMGEVWLFSDRLFIQFGTPLWDGAGILYRRCKSREDSTGTNCWMRYDTLLENFPAAIDRFKATMNSEHRPPSYIPADFAA